MTRLDATRYGPWCVIAGGSEGIGAAFAASAASAGLNLLLVARRARPLETLAGSLREAFAVQVLTLAADLAAEDALDRVAEAARDVDVGLLIYNAGAAPRMANFHDMANSEATLMARLNVVGQTVFAWHFGRAMRARGRGGIILLSSLAYASGIGRLATYAASKAYTQILGEGLWYELKPHGVDVLALAATTTRTPAMQRMGMPLDDPAYPSVEPEQVVAEGFAALGVEPVHHVNASEVTARAIQAMPRRQAVTLVSEGMERAIPIEPGERAACP